MQKLIVKLTKENSKLLEVVAEDKHEIAEFKQKILQLKSDKVDDKRKIAQLKSENVKLKHEKILLNPTKIDLETLEKHSWNSDDRSLNIFVKDDDPLTFYRYPVAQTTDCIRGKTGYSKVKNECSFDSITWKYPNYEISNDEKYVAPKNIFCILDMNKGLMAFSTDNNYLGVAFRGLKGKKLYPIVGSVWGHCEVTMKYFGGYDE
uniref:SPRY domain-containing protein n=1 Tax=Panagrolaimus sp. PS1159 TaxID=55785 RepID=A0AC35F767_9BILA